MKRKNFFIEIPTQSYDTKHLYINESASAALLDKAGYIHQLSSGVFSFYPIMERTLQKLTILIHHYMVQAGFQKIYAATLQPTAIWEESGRLNGYKADALFTITDRTNKEFCLSPTAEEAVLKMIPYTISHKDLPVSIFQISLKYRDELRPRFGLLRCKEFIMKDAYSFSSNKEGMMIEYYKVRQAYIDILEHLQIKYIIAKAQGGQITSSENLTEEFQVLSDTGEDVLLIANDLVCNVEEATTSLSIAPELKIPVTEFNTHDKTTIEDVAFALNISPSNLLKSLVMKYHDEHDDVIRHCMVLIRGDRQINIAKIKSVLNTNIAIHASESDLAHLGFIPGNIGPINIPTTAQNMVIIVDQQTKATQSSFICGSNRLHYHMHATWTDISHEYKVHDILKAHAGDIAPNQHNYIETKGIEIGHIFCLGTSYSENMNVLCIDNHGVKQPMFMGCYGIGVTRLLASCVEQMHDAKGIVWPNSIAPFAVNIIPAKTDNPNIMKVAESIYESLLNDNIDAILDDRNLSLGERIHEAEFIGLAACNLIIGNKSINENRVIIECRNGVHIECSLDETEIVKAVQELKNISILPKL